MGGDDNREALLVPIDVSKYFHKGMILGPGGEVIEEPFEIDVYQEGFQSLLKQVEAAQRKGGKKKVIFAVEPTSYYHQSLLDQLTSLGHEVKLVNPSITSRIRSLYYDRVKTDDIDLKMIGKSLSLGKGTSYQSEKWAKGLRRYTRQYLARAKMTRTLKIQLHQHIDALWPGLCNPYDRSKGLAWNLWENKMVWALLQICPYPQKVAKLSPKQLFALFRRHRVKGIGLKTAERIIRHAKQIPTQSPSPQARYNLKHDMALLHHLQSMLTDLEKQVMAHLPEEAKYLLSMKGISPFFAASFLAEIETIRRFATPKQLIRYVGLSVSVKESGMRRSKNNKITKSGNRYLRYLVMTMARNVARLNPSFQVYAKKFEDRGKAFYDVVGCVATKLLKVIHTLLTRKEAFDPNKMKSR